jgi:hypothetical protein
MITHLNVLITVYNHHSYDHGCVLALPVPFERLDATAFGPALFRRTGLLEHANHFVVPALDGQH